MIIEFAGVPGSGKTFSSNRLREWLRRKGITYVDVDEFVRSTAARSSRPFPRLNDGKLDLGSTKTDVFLKGFHRFLVEEHQYVLRYLATLFLMEKDKRIGELVASSFCYCCAKRGYLLKKAGGANASIIIHEEGFTQRLFTLFGYSRVGWMNADLRDIARLTPKPDVVIWTRCAAHIAAQRVKTRAEKIPHRLAGLAGEDAACVLENADKRLGTALSVLEARSVRVIELRTDADCDDFYIFQKLLSDVAS